MADRKVSSNDPPRAERIEVITSVQRRRHWTAQEKVRLVEETYLPGQSVSLVARRHELNATQLDTSKNRSHGGFWKHGTRVRALWGSDATTSPARSGSDHRDLCPQAVLVRKPVSQTARFMLWTRLASPIFTLARAKPMVRTTSPIGPF